MQIGPYRVVREVARGSFGVVLEAEGPRGRVAIKQLLPGALEEPDAVKRFHREGSIAARLQHPSIVPLLDRGQSTQGPYHVFPYVDGASLRDVVRSQGPLEPRRAAQIVLELCGALQHAHEQGVLHRDLKPANVLLTSAGSPQLTDFGLAQDASVSTTRLTLSGEVMGSPVYMPPEQARGERARIGPASDVYGLGAIFYTLLTGQPPISGSGLEEVLRKVIRDPIPSPATLVPEIPTRLAAVCMRCLEKHPDDRYVDMRTLAKDLRDALAPRPEPAPSAGPPWVLIGVGLAVGLLAVLVALLVAELAFGEATPGATPASETPATSSEGWPEPEPEPTVADHLEQARASLARFDYADTERALERAFALDPQSGQAHLIQGRLHQARDEPVAAFEAWGRAHALLESEAVERELAALYPNPELRRLLWLTFVPESGELAEAALLCNKLIDSPELDVERVLAKLDRIAEGLRPRLAGLEGRARLERLIELQQEVVTGNFESYSDPANSRLAEVIERKRGVHITCALVLIALGRRLDVELEPLCFPGWFMARWDGDPPAFVNAYDGRAMPMVGMQEVFEKSTDHLEFSERALAPSTRQEVLVRLTRWQAGNFQRARRYDLAQRALEVRDALTPVDREAVERAAFGER